MSAFVAARIRRSHAFELALALERAFACFEPEGERAWAPGWEPRYLHPRDGRAEPGMVFATGEGEELTLWTLLRHEPAAGRVEYSRVTPASRVGIVRVQCEALGPQRTRVTVDYELTGLNEAGNRILAGLGEAEFARFIEGWREAIGAAAARAQPGEGGSVK